MIVFSLSRYCASLIFIAAVCVVGASAQSDRTDYIKSIIQKARDASGVQESPAIQDAKPVQTPKSIKSETISTSNSPTSTTSSTIPVTSGSTSSAEMAYPVRHGELPADRDYWSFLNFYRSHAVVSLVVSGIDDKALARALEELNRLQDRGVQIGEVVVSGGRYIADLNAVETPTDPPITDDLSAEEVKVRRAAQQKRVSALSKLSLAVGLGVGDPVDVSPVIERLAIQYSPTWVVRYRGRDYVYEGLENPSTLFSKDGVYRGGER